MSASVSYTDREYGHFRNAQIGLQLSFKKLITKNLKLGLGARLNFVNIKEVSEALEAEISDAAGKSTVVGFLGTLAYKNETIAANGDVKSGIRIKMSLYPSYVDKGAYMKAYVEANGTFNLATKKQEQNHTLSTKVALGYAANNTPFYEKLYAGGDALASTSMNYSFPIWKDINKGVVFVDAAFISEADLGRSRICFCHQ